LSDVVVVVTVVATVTVVVVVTTGGHMPVINMRDLKEWTADTVYIGRAGKGFEGEYGNPFRVGVLSRERVLNAFEAYARERIAAEPEFAAKVLALKGKTLVCFCAPLPCHGDVLLKLADELAIDEGVVR
jgi:hypothetical protein